MTRRLPQPEKDKTPLGYLQIPEGERPTIAFMRRLLHYGTLDLRRLALPTNAPVLADALSKVDGVLTKMLDSEDQKRQVRGLYLTERFAKLQQKATQIEREFQARMLEAGAVQRVAELSLEAIKAENETGGSPETLIQNITAIAPTPVPDVKRLTQPSGSVVEQLGIDDSAKEHTDEVGPN